MQTSYLDLYLVTWPGAPKSKATKDSNVDPNLSSRLETWKTLIELKNKGLLKSIGVSNHTVKHLEHLKANFTVKPDVNQVCFNCNIFYTFFFYFILY